MKEELQEELKQAMQAGNKRRLGVLRLLLAAIHNREIEKGDELTKAEIVSVVKKEAKNRREAIAMYKKGERDDLVEKEQAELAILQEFLPEQMDDQALEEIVTEVIEAVQPQGQADFGRVMGQVMEQVGNKAAGNRVAEVVREKL